LPFFFFYTGPPSAEIYTLSLHDALPISFCLRTIIAVPAARRILSESTSASGPRPTNKVCCSCNSTVLPTAPGNSRSVMLVPRARSEEHTSELQSRSDLVCRLLLEKKKHT